MIARIRQQARQIMHRHFVRMLVSLMIFSTSCLAGQEPSALRARLKSLSGPDAAPCGMVPLAVVDNDAFNCAKDTASEGKAFWAAFAFQGIDSDVWQGVAGDGHGKQWLIAFDSYGGGNLTVWSCASLTFTYLGNAVKCEQPTRQQ